ncbi:hypothetical protein [Paraburkholderia bannensis]|uniref:hypothetical protein n=1 Tax=Paraburkholderia bannensis TaxID=765414 RepID=UPI002AB6DE67|nr:hypothetical protein [Paraburkholderia bannensis]
MQTLCRNSLIGVALSWFCASITLAMSHGSIDIDVKQIDDKPAFCLPVSDDNGSDPIQISRVGVSRETGVAQPAVTYWDEFVPVNAQPAYLKRGECLAFGQIVPGAIVDTPATSLDVNKYYSFALIPGGDAEFVYAVAFCVLRQADGKVRIAVPGKQSNPCGSLGY